MVSLEQHVGSLFTTDADGDLIQVNDWRKNQVAPLFYLGRNNESHLVKFHQRVPEVLRQAILPLVAEEPLGPNAPILGTSRYLELLGGVSDTALKVWTGPAYCFHQVVHQPDSHIEIIGAHNQWMLQAFMGDWLADVPHEQPMMGWVEQNAADRPDIVGVCASVRISADAMAAGIEVIPQYRHLGIGRALALAWAAEVESLGKIAMYSTSSDNTASKNLASSMALQVLGSDFHISG